MMLNILIQQCICMTQNIEFSDASSKISEILWQYYRNEPALDINDNIINLSANDNNSILFNFKQQITGQTGNGGTKGVEIIVHQHISVISGEHLNVFN